MAENSIDYPGTHEQRSETILQRRPLLLSPTAYEIHQLWSPHYIRFESHTNSLAQCFPNFVAHGPLLARKITTDPHTLAHVNIE
jgi:hypothetical protein